MKQLQIETMRYHAPGWSIVCYDDGTPWVRPDYDEGEEDDRRVLTFQLWAPNVGLDPAIRMSGHVREQWAFCWSDSGNETLGTFVRADDLDGVLKLAARDLGLNRWAKPVLAAMRKAAA